jgi:flagellar hook-associated protein 1 FlgK
VLTNADSAQQGVSGVNLDEEAANLLKYQQAYQAASKVIATAGTLFDQILALMK